MTKSGETMRISSGSQIATILTRNMSSENAIIYEIDAVLTSIVEFKSEVSDSTTTGIRVTSRGDGATSPSDSG